jgi:hypothetical protein
VFTFTRSGDISSQLRMPIQISGMAIRHSDYEYTGDLFWVTNPSDQFFPEIEFAPGAATAELRVRPKADTVTERDETVSVNLLDYWQVRTTGVIENDDGPTPPMPIVNVSVAPGSVQEDAGENLVFTFTRTGDLSQALTIQLSINGSAAGYDDFNYYLSSPLGRGLQDAGFGFFGDTGFYVQFDPGSATTTLTVVPVPDATIESDETVEIAVGRYSELYGAGDSGTAIGIIRDDDTPPTITVSVAPGSVLEDSGQELIYTFTRDGDLSRRKRIGFDFAGTADSNSDLVYSGDLYHPGPTEFWIGGPAIEFAAGSATAIVRVRPNADTAIEADETVTLRLRDTPGVFATAIIQNDDGLPPPTPIVIGFDPTTGNVLGSSLPASGVGTTKRLSSFGPGPWQNVLTGDFNGDGVTDVAVRNDNGAWLVGASQTGGYLPSVWGGFVTYLPWSSIQVGDVNADGKDDIVGYLTNTGEWWAAISTGASFQNRILTHFATHVGWSDFLVADFTGDGRVDVAARTNYGQWWMAESSAAPHTLSQLHLLTAWSTSVGWRDVSAADMNGDGKADIVGRAVSGGTTSQWWLAQTRRIGPDGPMSAQEMISMPRRYVADLSPLAGWVEPAGWNVVIADTDGDHQDEILGRTNAGEWWQVSKKLSSNTAKLGQWQVTGWLGTFAGDVDGDGKEDLIGRKGNGEWIVSRFPAGPGSQVNSTPANWPANVDMLFASFGSDRFTSFAKEKRVLFG